MLRCRNFCNCESLTCAVCLRSVTCVTSPWVVKFSPRTLPRVVYGIMLLFERIGGLCLCMMGMSSNLSGLVLMCQRDSNVLIRVIAVVVRCASVCGFDFRAMICVMSSAYAM